MNILLAVDNDDLAEVIAGFALEQKEAYKAHFKVVHVLSPIMLDHPLSSVPLFLEPVTTEFLHSAESLARHIGLIIRDRLKTPHVEEVVCYGDAVNTIVELAKSWPADLIIIGSRNTKGLSRFFLGSVSFGVVSQAPCTTLVARNSRVLTSSNMDEQKTAITEKKEAADLETSPAS